MTIDQSAGLGIGEQEAGPGQQARPGPERLHDCEEEVPVQGVVGLSEVQERHETGPPLLGHEVGEVAEEEDIGPDEAARQESGLLKPNHGRQGGPQPGRQDLGEETVVGAEEGDRAVTASLGAIAPVLVQHRDDPIQEAHREAAGGPDGCEDIRQDGGQAVPQSTVEVGRNAIPPRRLARGRGC